MRSTHTITDKIQFLILAASVVAVASQAGDRALLSVAIASAALLVPPLALWVAATPVVSHDTDLGLDRRRWDRRIGWSGWG
jgi:hypothetical protein